MYWIKRLTCYDNVPQVPKNKQFLSPPKNEVMYSDELPRRTQSLLAKTQIRFRLQYKVKEQAVRLIQKKYIQHLEGKCHRLLKSIVTRRAQ